LPVKATTNFNSLWSRLKNVVRPLLVAPPLGARFWDSSSAEQAYENGGLRSMDKARSGTFRAALRNCTPFPLVLCWLDSSGVPHHYYKVEPYAATTTPENMIAKTDHIETTSVGHAFCWAICSDVKKSKDDKTFDELLGGFMATQKSDREEKDGIPLITIKPSRNIESCCSNQPEYVTAAEWGQIDYSVPYDTSDKIYESTTLGGWPVRLEKNWHGDDAKLKKLLASHFKIATKFLPSHARAELSKSTPFYINKSQKYGPAACPVNGRAMCFHPGSSWLKENGMSCDKKECVEIYNAKEYLDDYEFWGPGGVLLHELCHAYHWKMVEGGYENEEIVKCYKAAMEEGLYDCVEVHKKCKSGPQTISKDKLRAYACENAMEYFAELSVAFLAGLEKDVEYNKWQPFNRHELKEFDPRAHQLLQKIWKVQCKG